ncbi:g4495 [Coccomyxa viridis]|uniref:G4495 protein n=1 Tax=Coccomyxa viridis TaxID=1274662 RepID=A0ABP1FTH3_9CHLO
MERHTIEPGRLAEWIGTFKRQTQEVQELMQLAPECPEFSDLLSTIERAIATAEAELQGPRDTCASESEDGFTVNCESIPLDLPSCSPTTVAKHVTAIQQRAAVLGCGPLGWAIGAICHARADSSQEWQKAVIEGVSPEGKFLVDWLPSAREQCFQVESSDLRLVPPIAGAFWTPKQPPAYDKSLPVYPVVYEEDEKAAQRAAYDEQLCGFKDALANGSRSYTFPPGVYRSREKIYMEGVSDFTLTLANVEWISEEDSFIGLRCCHDITVLGPVALDGDPLRYSQCEITDSDGASWLEMRVMPGYSDPSTEGKVVFYDPTGKTLPTGQTWVETVTSLGDGRFRMDFAWGHKHSLRVPGVCKKGNFILQGPHAGAIDLSCNTNVTLRDMRMYWGGEPWGLSYGVNTFTNLRGVRRPGTNRLSNGLRFFQVWYEGGSFIADGCEAANNDDDLSDIFTYMGYTCANAQGSDNSILGHCGAGMRWLPGNRLKLYTCQSLEVVGEATVKAVERCTDKAAYEVLLAAYKESGKGPQHASFEDFQLVQLDQPVDIDGLTLIENLDTKPERISFTNCYFHDGMNCGIVPKGAIEALVANCIVERTSVVGIEASIGEEGAFPGSIVVRNNTVRDAYHTWADVSPSGKPGFKGGPSIAVNAAPCAIDEKPSGCPIQSARIVGNLSINPHGTPITVTECRDVVICGNLPADPLRSDALDHVTTA